METDSYMSMSDDTLELREHLYSVPVVSSLKLLLRFQHRCQLRQIVNQLTSRALNFVADHRAVEWVVTFGHVSLGCI